MDEFVFKVILLGEKATGKTSLIRRYVHGSFEGRYAGTIGLNVSNKKIEIDKTVVNLLIYDIEAESDFESLFEPFTEGSVAALFVYDVTRLETLHAVDNWVKRLNSVTENLSLKNTILIGNKIDLPRTVEHQLGEKTAEDLKLHVYLETSAKNDENVDIAFLTLAKNILENV
ncbi:MAG: GTP-binding protein [Candidatus Thorarchaeota archaeon]